MKTLNRNILANVVILLLAISLISLVSAHGSDESANSSHNDGGHMMQGNSMMDSFDNMIIEGSIRIEESITLDLVVSPSEEMSVMMDDQMGSRGHMDDQSMIEDYMNTISVEFYSLIEFEDMTGNGFSSDDTQLSNFTLNNLTLNQPEIVVGSSPVAGYRHSLHQPDVRLATGHFVPVLPEYR